MKKWAMRFALVLVMLVAVVLSSGCAYMKNRGADFLDVLDLGFTGSPITDPGFAVYAEVVPIATVGMAEVKGGMFGIGSRRGGVLHIVQTPCYGGVFWGKERIGIERTATGAEAAAQAYSQGIVRVIAEGDEPPWYQFLDVEASVHLGWGGVHVRVKPIELVDFIVGLTTLDFRSDDIYTSSTAAEALAAETEGGESEAPPSQPLTAFGAPATML